MFGTLYLKKIFLLLTIWFKNTFLEYLLDVREKHIAFQKIQLKCQEKNEVKYKSVIRPSMEYCCHIWAGALATISFSFL